MAPRKPYFTTLFVAVRFRRGHLPRPKSRQRRLEPAAYSHRCDPQRQPGGVVGLDRDTAERRGAERRFEAPRRNAGRKAPQWLVLLHADDGVVIAGHAGVGHVGGAAGEDLVIGGRHMGVGADHETGAAVAEKSDRLLFTGRLAMEI